MNGPPGDWPAVRRESIALRGDTHGRRAAAPAVAERLRACGPKTEVLFRTDYTGAAATRTVERRTLSRNFGEFRYGPIRHGTRIQLSSIPALVFGLSFAV
jgi:hypothetical protein